MHTTEDRSDPLLERSEEAVAAGLLDAQGKGQGLFAAIESRGIICAGATEKEINENVYALAEELYGVTRHWHKRIVHAGQNTLAPATSTRNLIPKTGSN